MLKVLHGENKKKRSLALENEIISFVKKGFVLEKYNDSNFIPEEMISIAENVSLFGDKKLVVITGVLDNTGTRDEAEKFFSRLSDSEQVFIFSENFLPIAFVRAIKESGGGTEEFADKTKEIKKESFNIFSLTDAVAERKRTLAWAKYREAILHGVESRELAGKIFWAMKTMAIANSSDVKESGLHPFVYGKAKTNSKNFTKEEMDGMLKNLTILFHENFDGEDLEIEMEKFLLTALAK